MPKTRMPEASPPMDAQELAKFHPLFSRLTGQVIWTLFEEHGASQAVADVFMDRYLSWREACLRILEPVLLGRESMPSHIQVLADGAAWVASTMDGAASQACPSCAALHGRVIPTAHPNAISFLPPYSLGCRARPVALSQADFAALDAPLLMDLGGETPRKKLTCDSEWILDHAWA